MIPRYPTRFVGLSEKSVTSTIYINIRYVTPISPSFVAGQVGSGALQRSDCLPTEDLSECARPGANVS